MYIYEVLQGAEPAEEEQLAELPDGVVPEVETPEAGARTPTLLHHCIVSIFTLYSLIRSVKSLNPKP